MKNIIPKAGDLLEIWRNGYRHYGICTAYDRVVHYAGDKRSKLSAVIKATSLSEFASGGNIKVVVPENALPVSEVVSLAESGVGKRGYNLIFNNCEHFARECKTGEGRSGQVEGVAMGGLFSVAVAIASRRPQVAVAISLAGLLIYGFARLAEQNINQPHPVSS